MAIRETRKQLFGEETEKLELLTTPICKLDVSIRNTEIDGCIKAFNDLLREWRIKLRPHYYVGDEWGCIEKTANISIPFWELDETLKQLNKESRGWYNTRKDIIEHLYHEFGHAFNYAHRLYNLKRFRKVFKVKGSYFDGYPIYEKYTPNPWSKDYVNPCGDHYAQAHPDEDFAETFMVVIHPRYNFRRRLKSKPGALKKCLFVEELIQEYGSRDPKIKLDGKQVLEPANKMRTTVAEYFETRIKRYRKKATGFIDPYLLSCFPLRMYGDSAHAIPADGFVKEHQRQIVAKVSHWTTADPEHVRLVLEKIRRRCDVLDLATKEAWRENQLISLTGLVTTLVLDYFHTGKYVP